MATFQFSSRRVELDFPGGIKHSLPLTEEMRQKVESAAKELVQNTASLRGKPGTAEDLEALCDYTLDAVDAILGEGAAEQIMEFKENYSFLDCADLFKFVTDEFNAAFIQEVHSTKTKHAAAASGNQNKQPVSVPNRAQRRRHRRKH